MTGLLSHLGQTVRGLARARTIAVAIAGVAVTTGAVLLVPTSAPAQGSNNLANIKGSSFQQYLNGSRGGSMPSRPAYNTPHAYTYPQRSVLQVSPLPYQHAVPQAAVVPQVVVGPAPVVAPAEVVVQRLVPSAPAVETQPVAFVIAHLPPGADAWIDEKLMFADVKAPEVTMVTPPLEKGKWYTYTARVRWVEDGKWVGQMHTFDIRAGDIHHMEVTPTTAPAVQNEIAASLEKLAPADRKAAASQKFCAVQDTIRLGSMGPPVKVTLDGKDVFLCCKGCEPAAKKDPAKAIEAAAKNKDKQ